jgi:hypothetical protein
VFSPLNDRPYFETWLKRARRQLAASGRLSQVAIMLAHEDGGTPDAWVKRLRKLLNEEETPSLELLTRIDSLLAGPGSTRADSAVQERLF